MSIFSRTADIVVKHHKAIVVLWIAIFITAIAANQVWRLEDLISYSIEGFIPKDTESAQADRIIEEQFPTQTTVSSIVIIIEGANTTNRDIQNFTLDLDEMIFASQYIGSAYPFIPFELSNGQTIVLTEQVEYLADPTQATIYSAYRLTAFSLGQNLTAPLHENVTATGEVLNVYYGIPFFYVTTWSSLGGTQANNSAAYNLTKLYISSLPPQAQPLSSGYFEVFAGFWNASFFDPRYTGSTPMQRGDGVIVDALPVFLNQVPLPPEAKAMQLNFTQVFNMTNFVSSPLIENYTFSVFSTFVPLTTQSFFADMYTHLPANADYFETLNYSRSFVRRFSLDQLESLIPFPYDLRPFYFSPDYTITLLNYGLTESPDFEAADGSHPVRDDVVIIRGLVQDLKESTGATFEVYTSGSAASDFDQNIIFGGAEEFIVTLVLVIILIGLYFRSVVSPFFPIGMIAIAIMVSNLFIFIMAIYFFTIDFTTTAVLQTILLAAGTDYSIFLISRYKDERLDGKSREEAVRQSVTWAGESIATSGGAVLLSFAALGLASFPVVRTMGISIGFAITIAILLAITLVPSILLLIGNRVFWPYNRRMRQPRRIKSITRGYFRSSAQFSMKHAKAIVLASILISIPATYLVITENASYDFSKGVPPTESSMGLDAMSSAFGAGFFYKSYVVVQFPDRIILQDGNLSITKMYALENLTTGLQSRNGGIKSTQGPVNPEGTIIPYRNWATLTQEERDQLVELVSPYVGEDNRTARIFMVLSSTVFSSEAVSAVDKIKEDIRALRDNDGELRSALIYVGGATAIIRDVAESTNNDLKVMALVVAIGLFLILMVVLGSLLIPLRALLTILLSITWTLATTIILFKLWRGLDMVFVLPLIVFVLAMGLGMDYDIFIITRIREEVSKGRNDRQAILTSITRTGGIISACGIIMAGAFATLMLSPLPFLQQMGFALAFVILLDSMIVRIYLVPAIMVLAGKYNWWAPGFLQRIKRPEDASSEKEVQISGKK